MKKTLLLLLLTAGYFSARSQCIIPGNTPDSLFPVTNSVYMKADTAETGDFWFSSETAIFNIAKKNNSLYMFGTFTSLGPNHGRGVVIDSTSKNVVTKHKWKIDGEVKISIADGQGGFYIGGNFKKIGDSARSYFAHIDASGRPLPRKLDLNGQVYALYRKNDTLFIGGSFDSIQGKLKKSFAIYSLSADTVFRQHLLNGPPPNYPNQVTAFKVYKDTLVVAGKAMTAANGHDILKFNMTTLSPTGWRSLVSGDHAINAIDVSYDYRTLVFVNESSRKMVAVDLFTGALKFDKTVALSTTPVGSGVIGYADDVQIVGNKIFLAGRFNHVYNPARVRRRGLVVFDIRNGNMLDTDFALDNYAMNLDLIGDKLYVTGLFSRFSGVEREHFAELDTATLTPTSWNLAPSDPIATFTVSNGKFFAGGVLNGVHFVRRNGMAAIDVTTNEILPFNPVISIRYITAPRRMVMMEIRSIYSQKDQKLVVCGAPFLL